MMLPTGTIVTVDGYEGCFEVWHVDADKRTYDARRTDSDFYNIRVPHSRCTPVPQWDMTEAACAAFTLVPFLMLLGKLVMS